MVVSGRTTAKKAVMIAAIPVLKASGLRAGFERDDLVFEDFGVGMGEARVDEVGALALSAGTRPEAQRRPLGRFGAGEDVSGTAKYRGPGRPKESWGRNRGSEPRCAAARGCACRHGLA